MIVGTEPYRVPQRPIHVVSVMSPGMPSPARPGSGERVLLHHVVALVVPPQSPFELAGVAQVFGVENPGLPARYRFEVCAETPGAVPVMAGCPLLVERGLEATAEADTVIVAGWPDLAARPSDGLVSALRAAHARGARVVGL
ncbi:hypothetical protein DZF91_35680, partial [Actinomadura logoneensis]